MSDINETDLAYLLGELRDQAANGYKTCQYAALTALIAERYRLGKCVRDLERQLEANPPADRDRDLRERLVCAAATATSEHTTRNTNEGAEP
jgi:hypothetical protein